MESKRTEYGTMHDVTVEMASKKVILVIAELINEAFVLVDHGILILPKPNDKGKIVFTKGGVMGGYWKFYHSAITTQPLTQKTPSNG